MTEQEKTKVRDVLKMIADDMAADSKNFECAPFNGRTVATYLGNLGAAVAALAGIIATLVPEP